MCYYNGVRVTKAEYIRLKNIEKELTGLQLSIPARSGFDYKDWPIIKPNADGSDFDIKMIHWEYIPPFVHDELELKEYRKQYTWLNAKSENLFVNDKGKLSIYRDGAMNGRCLFLSTGFFEFMHIPKMGKKGQPLKATEKIPYYIKLRNKEYFFMAGVSREWTNINRGLSAETAAIVTRPANKPMEQIHNTKKRMPLILPDELAWEWIQPNLTEERIKEIAAYMLPGTEMIAWPVKSGFVNEPDPTNEIHYNNVPEIEYE